MQTLKIYGVYDKMEWHAAIACPNGVRLRVVFDGGSASDNGVIPATYRTDNPAIQLLIESSELYRKGYIKLAKVHERPGESAVSVYRRKSAASSGKKSSGSTVESTASSTCRR